MSVYRGQNIKNTGSTPNRDELIYEPICQRCNNEKCRGEDIYDCCDVEDPQWIQRWVKNMYKKNNA